MNKPIIPIPRASEKLVKALIDAGVLIITDNGVKCAEK